MIEQDSICLVYDRTGQKTPGLRLNRTVYAWFIIKQDSDARFKIEWDSIRLVYDQTGQQTPVVYG